MNIMFYATVISTNIDKSDMQYIVCCNLLNSCCVVELVFFCLFAMEKCFSTGQSF